MTFKFGLPSGAPWTLAFMVSTALIAENASARFLAPGTEDAVFESYVPESWRLQNAQLTVHPGGQTKEIDARGSSTVTIDGGQVSSSGAAGVLLESSKATINNATIVATHLSTDLSDVSFGLQLYRYDAVTGSSSAVVTNSNITGAGRGVNAFDGAQVTLNNSYVKGNAGQDPIGPISGGVGMVLGGSKGTLLGSTVVGDNNGVVMLTGRKGMDDSAAALVVTDGSSVIGETGSAILVGSNTNPDIKNLEAVIEVSNGSTLHGGNGVILQVEQEMIAAFNVSNSQLNGDVLVEDGATARLTLNNNARLTGVVTNASTLDIDKSSFWKMAGDSSIGKLTLNGGTVDIRSTGGAYQRLTLGELSGAGTFALGTQLATGEGDFLDVTGTASGTHQLLVRNSGVDPLKGADAQQLVHTGGGDAQFAVIGGKVDFGTFAYELEQREDALGGSDWFLVQTSDVSAGTRSVIGLFSAAPTVWYGESSTLRSRMGELRNGNGEGGGWMRSYGNKYNMSAGGGVAYKQVQQGISFGADAPMPVSDGQWLVGVMGGYSKSDLDLQGGTSGKIDSYYLGAYSTWLADDGFYVDALIKANRFQNASDVRMGDGEKAKGTYNNYGLGASVEAGKHIKLQDEWFVEPFAQASGLWVSGEEYSLDNGMRASSNKADSLLGKVGTHVGRKFALDDGGFVEPYVKVAAAHEFVTSNSVKVNDNRFTNDLSGSRGEVGVGVAAQVTEKLQLHTDLDYMKGNSIEQPWGVNVGMRYNW
jgi:outer membrane autotransporter protein